ncbi:MULTISPECIES: homoserine dehydrogenase [Hyphomicrobium]|uniref:homoserine dehydrogenase n=1 Tax=Hyphomicrobium TaxID=81 RepID=UPI0015707460|nr:MULTISPECIES: homoserine dehydrogenase [Hyphomicrobium]MBI1650103.1 homoserine dehydrogenase [Hyphomicrobium sulfonivorans]MDH4982774.1 homoserine dehydrogenase [Hyphomicrobium sp. D-2]NSL73020.1 homoserine dehydrogenase [Hyphomicrobium sulfonivorans]
MTKSLKLGVAGLGTVGTSLIELLATHRDRLANLGSTVDVVAVSARSKDKHRAITETAGVTWFDDPIALARDPAIDVFVELIGGEDGVAKEAVEAALNAGKHVVTANKALLAKHGVALAQLAEEKGVALNFEAAVAGGIPVIKTLRESLAANSVRRVYGILNGTCNYILSTMTDEKRSFADALKEAQDLGYAEADPTFDIGGFDTAHKLAILASLAFGTEINFDEIDVEGIQSITDADIEAAEDMGYCIKLLGVATQTDSGIEMRVNPAMVPEESAIAEVWGATNGVAIDSDFCGSLLLVGPGAGGKATASSVAGDIVDIARGIILPPLMRKAASLTPCVRSKLGSHQGAYYVRLSVYDRPGTMAAIAKHMGDRDISIESMVQGQMRAGVPGAEARTKVRGAPAPVRIITHETTEEAIRQAVEAIEQDGKVSERPQVIRIEKLG